MDNSYSENLHGHESAQMTEYVDAKENASSSSSSQRNEVEQEGVQGFDENNKVAKKTKNQTLTPEERIERRKAAERARYHRKTPEQKKAYNQHRNELKKVRRAERRRIHSAQLKDARREERNEKQRKAREEKARRAEKRRIHSAQLTVARREEQNEKQRKARAEKARKKQDLDPCGFFAQMERKIARQTSKAIKKILEN